MVDMIFYVMVAAGAFVLDYKIKNYIEKNKEYNDPEEIMGGNIIIRKIYNRGAIMNFMDHKQRLVSKVSVMLTLALSVCYVWVLLKKGWGGLKFALSLVLGGAISNTYDRVMHNYVVDYFSFNTKIQGLKKIVFNISDMFIFLGAAIAVVWSWFAEE